MMRGGILEELCLIIILLAWNPKKCVRALDVPPLPIDERSADSEQFDNDIAFKLPDLTTTIETAYGEYRLEAFKSVNNDRILREPGRPAELIWVSPGEPLLTHSPSPLNDTAKQVFHFSNYGFYTDIQMLTPAHRRLLASTATAKYGVTVNDTQIVHLILSQFECSLVLYDSANNKYLLEGKISSFRSFPLKMYFLAPPHSVERKLFKEYIASKENLNHLQLSCTMRSRGKVVLTNTLTISSEQTQQIGLEEKLFGPSSKRGEEVYVTRQQTSNLASEMYATLNIIEDYEMPETSFSEAFVDGLIKQMAVKSFSMESVDSVLNTLSTYISDISGDLMPDVIKRDLGSILKVEERGSKKRIILDKEAYNKLSTSHSQSGGFSVGVSYAGVGVSSSVNWADSNSKSSETARKDLSDQLDELNTASRSDVEWEIEGERIIPKSLNVARLSRAKMAGTMKFNRVRIQKVDAPFHREFSLYAHRAIASTPPLDQINSRVDQLEDELNQKISAISSSVSSLSSVAIRRCQICFLVRPRKGWDTGECQGSRGKTCSGWSTSPSFTSKFIDDTNERPGWCEYYWAIDCRTD